MKLFARLHAPMDLVGVPALGPLRIRSLRLPRSKLTHAVAAALLLVLLGLHLASLTRKPAPFVDEAWRASRAMGLIESGHPFGTLDAGVFDRYDGYQAFFPLLEVWFTSLGIRAFGLSIWSVRIVSLLFGLLLLLAIYYIGKRVSGPRVGLLAVIVVMVSPAFLLSAHLSRQDVMVAAFGYCAIALYLADRGSAASVRSLVSGLAAGLAIEIHPNGALYSVAIGALYVLDYRWAVGRIGRFWTFVAGLCVSALAYVIIHVLPNPETYRALVSLGYGPSHTPPLLVLDPDVWIQAALGQAFMYLVYSDLLVALFAVRLLKPSSANRRLLLLFVVLNLAFLALVRNKHNYYAILISPAGDLVIAAFLHRLMSGVWRPFSPSDLRPYLVCALLAVSVIRGAIPAFTAPDPMVEYRMVVEELRQEMPPGSRIMGGGEFWFGLSDHPVLAWEQLVYYKRYNPGSTLSDAFRALNPDFLVVDGNMQDFVSDDKTRPLVYGGSLYIPKAELVAFLDGSAELAGKIPTRAFGTVFVYRILGAR